jgi:3-oxoacyl-[acyl-carrier protein] reductase
VNFTGKTVIVTGAARGIGRSICLELARYGCNIAFNYSKSSTEAHKLVSELKAMGREAYCVQAGVEDSKAVEQMARKVNSAFGSIDYLVNNAGITRDRLILRMSEDEWDSVINTNLKGAFNFCKAVAPFMVKARFGSILNLTSVSGIMGSPGQVNYSASKAGLIGLTKALARELASRNITVNALALGFIETDMTRGLSEEYRAAALKEIPAGRFGSAEEIACIAAFLLSDDSRYITGQVIQADGGLGM